MSSIFSIIARRLLSTFNDEFIVLKNKKLIAINGIDTYNFLQGLITNDVSQLEKGNSNIIYSYILNPQGRIIYDTFLYRIYHENTPLVLVECEASIKDNILNNFKRHIIRKKVTINDEENNNVCVILPKSTSLDDLHEFHYKEEKDYISPDQSHHITSASTIQRDPRYDKLGLRCLIPHEDLERYTIGHDTPLRLSPHGIEHYTKYRYKLGIGEGPLDLPPEKCLPLESNGDMLNAVSFTKGCYVGQELTSRTHNMGVIRKRLLPIKFHDHLGHDFTIPYGAEIVDEKGLKCGVYRNRCRQYGLALLRLKESLGKSLCIYVDGQKITLTASVPHWMKNIQ